MEEKIIRTNDRCKNAAVFLYLKSGMQVRIKMATKYFAGPGYARYAMEKGQDGSVMKLTLEHKATKKKCFTCKERIKERIKRWYNPY